MYAPTLPLMVFEQDCNSAVAFVTTALESSGYVVLESFDLQSAMAVHDGSDCPPHSCACQMVVLLVYPRKGLPITLVFNSDDLQTAVFLTNSVNNPNHSRWVGKLAHLLPEVITSHSTVNP